MQYVSTFIQIFLNFFHQDFIVFKSISLITYFDIFTSEYLVFLMVVNGIIFKNIPYVHCQYIKNTVNFYMLTFHPLILANLLTSSGRFFSPKFLRFSMWIIISSLNRDSLIYPFLISLTLFLFLALFLPCFSFSCQTSSIMLNSSGIGEILASFPVLRVKHLAFDS